ncbi:MAG: DUF2244 domain-containing protein [Reyranellaceae bacterium]
MSENTPQTCYFDAELRPHRSLSARGFRLLIAVVAAANLAVGIAFFWSGAWPVFGFMGLDVALLYFLFRLNYRDANETELVRLTDDALVVRRIRANGEEQTWSLEPYWLRVEMDDPPRHDSMLVLAARERRLAVGSFLTPEERLEMAQALRRALHRQRNRPAALTEPA